VNTVKQQDPAILKNVFLVHGEINSMKSLSEALQLENYHVIIAKKEECYEL